MLAGALGHGHDQTGTLSKFVCAARVQDQVSNNQAFQRQPHSLVQSSCEVVVLLQWLVCQVIKTGHYAPIFVSISRERVKHPQGIYKGGLIPLLRSAHGSIMLFFVILLFFWFVVGSRSNFCLSSVVVSSSVEYTSLLIHHLMPSLLRM